MRLSIVSLLTDVWRPGDHPTPHSFFDRSAGRGSHHLGNYPGVHRLGRFCWIDARKRSQSLGSLGLKQASESCTNRRLVLLVPSDRTEPVLSGNREPRGTATLARRDWRAPGRSSAGRSRRGGRVGQGWWADASAMRSHRRVMRSHEPGVSGWDHRRSVRWGWPEAGQDDSCARPKLASGSCRQHGISAWWLGSCPFCDGGLPEVAWSYAQKIGQTGAAAC
jgi:hypothetical protein